MRQTTTLRIALILLLVLAVAAIAWGIRVSTVPAPPSADDLFDDSVLHDIWLQLSAEDIERLRDQFTENTFYRADFAWRDVVVEDIGIRSRGGATRNPYKPGLLLDFNRYIPEQEFLGLTQLVLDNAWHDESTLRERVAMLLFRRMGVAAPREVHARLYIGGDRAYTGAYLIVEDIDERFLRRNFDDDDGYLFEYERVDGYHLEEIEWSPSEYARRFDPITRQNDDPAVVFSALQQFITATNSAGPERIAAAIAPYLDLNRFLAFVAVTNYLAVWDSFVGDLGMANFYMYQLAGSTRFEFIPWDQDNAFADVDWPIASGTAKNVLLRKIWANPVTREQYLQKLLEVADAADGWLEQEVNRTYAQIREAVRTDPVKYRTNDEFEATAAALKQFAHERPIRVRAAVAAERNR